MQGCCSRSQKPISWCEVLLKMGCSKRRLTIYWIHALVSDNSCTSLPPLSLSEYLQITRRITCIERTMHLPPLSLSFSLKLIWSSSAITNLNNIPPPGMTNFAWGKKWQRRQQKPSLAAQHNNIHTPRPNLPHWKHGTRTTQVPDPTG